MTNIGEYYECYSKKIFGFLTMKGFRHERTFKHYKTKKVCWVYKMDEKLSKALKEWSAGKPPKDED